MTELISPLVADITLAIVYVMLLAAVAATLFSIVRTLRLRRKEDDSRNGVPTVRIAWTVAGAFAACLLITFMLGSTTPVVTNGQTFDDTFWLRTTDMLIYTSLILIIAFSAVIAINRFRS